VGHIKGSASHLSASGTTVYTDYDFAFDQLLKDNRNSPLGSAPDRSSRSSSRAHHTFKFLRYIPPSSSYTADDSLSTLIAVGNNWMIARKSFSNVTVPGFTRGPLEASTAAWLASCNN
jgi:hypothetical protein